MKQSVSNFLKGDIIESDYFNLSKNNLITLKEYFLQLQNRNEEFMAKIQDSVNSMKEKCPWIDDVAFNGIQLETTGTFDQTAIYLFPNEGHNLVTSYDKVQRSYKDIAKRIPKVFLLNKDTRIRVERQSELKQIQNELHEIDLIGRIFFNGLLYPTKSISGNFEVFNIPNLGISVWNEERLLANYYKKYMKSYNKPYLNNEEKEKVLTKIQIKTPNRY